ncbi:uncharacterized protein ACO6RY_17449 [Pungitius sinensis]
MGETLRLYSCFPSSASVGHHPVSKTHAPTVPVAELQLIGLAVWRLHLDPFYALDAADLSHTRVRGVEVTNCGAVSSSSGACGRRVAELVAAGRPRGGRLDASLRTATTPRERSSYAESMSATRDVSPPSSSPRNVGLTS